jgi:hypothetical protein
MFISFFLVVDKIKIINIFLLIMKYKLFNQMKQKKFNFCHNLLFLKFINFEKNSRFKYYEKILYIYLYA